MSLNDSLKAAPCATCRHCVYRQCVRKWPDTTDTGVVERVIRVVPNEHPFPAHHVHRFWCAKAGGSRGFEPSSGLSPSVYEKLARFERIDFYNETARMIRMLPIIFRRVQWEEV